MANKYLKKGQWIISMILIISMLCSCALFSRSAAPSSNTEYEHYKATDLSMQKSFDLFADDLFRNEIQSSGISFHFTIANPDSRKIKTIPLTLGDFSLEQMKKNRQDLLKLKKRLTQFSPKKLTKDQRITYEILSYYIDKSLALEGLELYSNPLTTTIGIQAQLPVLFAEYTFYRKEDVDHYLSLLSTIDDYYSQIIEFEKEKSKAGLFMSDSAADHVLKSCEAYVIAPENSFLSETFHTRIDGLKDLTEEEKNSYKEKNLQVLREHFIPAYKNLILGITSLMGTGKNDKGLFWYPDGKNYFECLVYSNIGTSYDSIESLKKAMEAQINFDRKAIDQITKDHPKIIEALDSYSFFTKEPEEILEALKTQMTKDFPNLPPCSHTVKYVPKALEASLSPAFYLVPPIDKYEENVIYMNGNPKFKNNDLYTTLAHEGYPGHLYQNVYFLSKKPDDLRTILSFSSYSEGWATYVEHYSYTLDNGLDLGLGELLAHNSAMTLGIYAYLDICINYEGWDREETRKYLKTFFHIEKEEVVNSIYEGIIENPVNYMEYYVGYLEIIEMRNMAEKALKDQFNLKNFHTFLLDIGPAPFAVILPEFHSWLFKELSLHK